MKRIFGTFSMIMLHNAVSFLKGYSDGVTNCIIGSNFSTPCETIQLCPHGSKNVTISPLDFESYDLLKSMLCEQMLWEKP